MVDLNSHEYICKISEREPTSVIQLLFKVTSRSHEVDHIDQRKVCQYGNSTVQFVNILKYKHFLFVIHNIIIY